MSVSVTLLKTTVFGTSTSQIGLLIQDDYSTDFVQFDSIAELKQQYPSKQSIVDHLDQFQGFNGSYYKHSDSTDESNDMAIDVFFYGFAGFDDFDTI